MQKGDAMKPLSFEYKDTSLVDESTIKKHAELLLANVEHLQDQIGNGYASSSGFVNLPSDSSLQEEVAALVDKKKALKPSSLIVCGIGGSNLGTVAIVEAIYGTLYNESLPIKVFFADTVDPSYVASIVQQVEQELKEGKEVILNVVTKSGTTTETIANFEIFLELLKKYRPDNFAEFVVATTDHGSPLHALAQENNFSILRIPKNIGGRYSVFSAVGQFPLGLLGINIHDLLAGARSGVLLGMSGELKTNYAVLSAIIKYELYKQKTDYDT